jgi:hypothetical protein
MFQIFLLLLSLLTLSSQSDLRIINTPSGATEPPPFPLTCVGIGTWNTTGYHAWKDSGVFPGKAYMIVDITQCMFVSLPVITTTVMTVDGGSVCPPVTNRKLYTSAFGVYTTSDTSAAEMRSNECDVHWSAFGYNG